MACSGPMAELSGGNLLPEGTDERTVGFVDIGSSHGTVSVVKFVRPLGSRLSTGEGATARWLRVGSCQLQLLGTLT